MDVEAIVPEQIDTDGVGDADRGILVDSVPRPSSVVIARIPGAVRREPVLPRRAAATGAGVPGVGRPTSAAHPAVARTAFAA